jgi:hypothetical protein
MASAEMGFRRLGLLFIQSLLLFSRFPESHEMIYISFLILANIEKESR